MRKSIEVVAAIIRQNNPLRGETFLMAERTYGEFEGWWEFPGGKMEPGETKAQTAVREIREELDLQIEADRLLCTVEAEYPSFHLTMHCMLCHVSEGQPHQPDQGNVCWATLEEAASLRLLPADVQALDVLRHERQSE